MNDKYLSGFGAGLILISFGIILSYFVATSVENQAAEQNQTINFEQLRDFQHSHKTLKNNPSSEEFRKFVGNSVDELKNKIELANSTLFKKPTNSTAINGTE